jgi:hypothetical protein
VEYNKTVYSTIHTFIVLGIYAVYLLCVNEWNKTFCLLMPFHPQSE